MRIRAIVVVSLLASCARLEAPPSSPAVAESARYGDINAYIAAVRARIRSNLSIPAEVPDTATVTFRIKLSDSGMVSALQRANTSGSVAYERSVESAIMKSQPLPLFGPSSSKLHSLELVFRVNGPDLAIAQAIAAFRLDIIRSAKPLIRYPEIAQQNGWMGTVVVQLKFSNGQLAQSHVKQASGYAILDASALKTMRKAALATAVPASLQGRDFEISLPYVFALNP